MTFVEGVDAFFSALTDTFFADFRAAMEQFHRDWLIVSNYLYHSFFLEHHTDMYTRCMHACWPKWSAIGVIVVYDTPLNCEYPRCAGNLGMRECARCG